MKVADRFASFTPSYFEKCKPERRKRQLQHIANVRPLIVKIIKHMTTFDMIIILYLFWTMSIISLFVLIYWLLMAALAIDTFFSSSDKKMNLKFDFKNRWHLYIFYLLFPIQLYFLSVLIYNIIGASLGTTAGYEEMDRASIASVILFGSSIFQVFLCGCWFIRQLYEYKKNLIELDVLLLTLLFNIIPISVPFLFITFGFITEKS